MLQVAGEREPAEIFDDLAEEIGGILAYPSGSFRDMNRPASQDSDRTRAEVHLPDGGQTRRNSVNSVDRMIEEEMQSQFPAQPIKISEVDESKKSNNNEQLASNIVVPKDVEDILRLVRSDTILQRANSSHPIEN
jgi:hypothetical protein